MKKDERMAKFLVFVWFTGIISFFFAVFVVFTTMINEKGHKLIVLYEPSNLVYWSEFILMFIILLLTVWLLYNYVSEKASLELVRKKR